MKAIILAGGYGKRLYPITLNKSKAFLKYKDKYIIDYILDDLYTINNIEEIIVITNNKFYNDFINYNNELTIINNNDCLDEANAIDNFLIVLNYVKNLSDVLLMACDNILSFSLKLFIDDFYKKNPDIHIMKYLENDINKSKKSMIIYNNIFIEKPSFIYNDLNYCIPPYYIFNKDIINQIIKIINNNEFKHEDSIGKLIELLKNNYNYNFNLFDMPGYRINY